MKKSSTPDKCPAATVVIVNYHSQELVAACVSSLKENVEVDLSYIVVDNSEVEEVESLKGVHPDITIITGHGNVGFAGGCNLGISRALEQKEDYILLLNPDTYAKDDFITHMLRQIEMAPQIAALGPQIILDDEKTIWYGGAKMSWWLKGPVHLFEDMAVDHEGSLLPVPFVSGCCMLLRAEAVREIGMMTEDYFLYFEDADYCQRIIAAGWQIAYYNKAYVYHKLSATTVGQSVNYVYYLSRNRVIFLRRWAKWYHFLVYMLFNTFVKLPGAILVYGIKKGKWQQAVAYLRGYWHGITVA